jgi:hypothetical protein
LPAVAIRHVAFAVQGDITAGINAKRSFVGPDEFAIGSIPARRITLPSLKRNVLTSITSATRPSPWAANMQAADADCADVEMAITASNSVAACDTSHFADAARITPPCELRSTSRLS